MTMLPETISYNLILRTYFTLINTFRIKKFQMSIGSLSFILSILQLKFLIYIIALTLIIKFFVDKCRRNPRHVKFAETVPGPSALPIIGNSLDLYLAGKGKQKIYFYNILIIFLKIFL